MVVMVMEGQVVNLILERTNFKEDVMKKFLTIISVIAATVLSFSSCQKEVIEEASQVESLGYHTLTFTAGLGEETKTTIHADGNRAIWCEEDIKNFLVLEHYTEGGVAKTQQANNLTVTFSDDNEVATIKATFANLAESCTLNGYQAVVAANVDGVNPKVASTQTPETNAYDKKADVLISQKLSAGANTSALKFNFDRVVCVNKMTLKGLTPGDKISQVVFTASTMLAPKFNIANENAAVAGVNSITCDMKNVTVGTEGNLVVYFISGTGDFTEPKVTVITDKALYEKTFTGKTITFGPNDLYSFGVSNLTRKAGVRYDLVESNEGVEEYGRYVIACQNAVSPTSDLKYAKVMGAAKTNNFGFSRAVAKFNDAKSLLIDESTATAFTLYSSDEKYYFMSDNGLYLRKTENDANDLTLGNENTMSYWTISITSDHYATIKNVGASSYTIRWNNANGNESKQLFSTYTSGENSVALYKKYDGASSEHQENTKYRIAVDQSIVNGSVSVVDGLTEAEKDAIISLTATPADGYEFEAWDVKDAANNKVTVTNNQFTMPASNVNVSASFKEIVVTDHEGTADDPYSVEDALKLIGSYKDAGQSATAVYVTGIVSRADASDFSSEYGNWTFTIKASDDSELMIYRCKDFGGVKFEGADRLKVGDTVTIFGKLKKYSSGDIYTPEVLDGYLISVNGKTFALSGIQVNTPKTEFNVGDEFEFGGSVIAKYNGKDDVEVTASAQFSGYDMSQKGTQTVTVTYTEDGTSVSATYVITVISNTLYNITSSFDSVKGNVAVKVNGAVATSAREGQQVTIEVKANEGYAVENFTVDGESQTLTSGAYSFTMPDRDVAVTATFVESQTATLEIIPNNAFWGTSYSGQANVSANSVNLKGRKRGLLIEMMNGTSTSLYVNDSQTRVYNGYSMKFTAPTGCTITAISFTDDGKNWAGTHTASVGTMTDNKNWSGNSESVTISFAGTCRMTGITVTISGNLPEPTLVNSIALDEATKELNIGGSFTLTATVGPVEADDRTVTWSSNNTSIATVDQMGKVTAIAEGEATITVTANDGSGVSASCVVTVVDNGGGSTKTKTYTFNSKSWGAKDELGNTANWAGSMDGNQYSGSQTPIGVQVTKALSGVTVTSPRSFEKVSKVVVTYSSSSNGVGSIGVKVGTTTLSNKSIAKSQSKVALTYDLSSETSGNVVITCNCTTNSLAIYSVAVTYVE